MPRALTQERIDAIVKRYCPRGYRVTQSRYRWLWRTAEVCDKKRVIACPTLNDEESVCLFLHEVGHVVLGHFKIKLPTHREEYEAEKFALNACRIEGIVLSKAIVDLARVRVRGHIKTDIKKGRKIERHIARWARHGRYHGRRPSRKDHQRSG